VRRNGKHAQGTICYTVSPLHTVQGYVDMAGSLVDMGCDSLCIKDMAALLKPQAAYDIVKGIKTACGEAVRVHVHTHATTGVTLVSLMKAIEAGADCVDTAISSLSLGPGHNPTESLAEMLEGTGYTTRVDKQRLRRIKDHFAKVRPRYRVPVQHHRRRDRDLRQPDPGRHDLQHGKPAQAAKAGDRLKEVLAEVPRVRADAGFPAAGDAISQIVGTQAVFNVMMGRYKA
jgi:methylmalonyl-CoA carboxyltransferase 5S subunit